MSEQGATVEKLKLAFALLLTLRGTPQPYSGDEIGMRDGDDPDNRRDFPGGFIADGDSPNRNAFTAEGRTSEEAEIHDYVQRMLALRRQHPALRHGKQANLFIDRDVYVFVQLTAGSSTDRLLVAANNADEPHRVEVDLQDTSIAEAHRLSPIFGNMQNVEFEPHHATFSMEGRSLCIFQVE